MKRRNLNFCKEELLLVLILPTGGPIMPIFHFFQGKSPHFAVHFNQSNTNEHHLKLWDIMLKCLHYILATQKKSDLINGLISLFAGMYFFFVFNMLVRLFIKTSNNKSNLFIVCAQLYRFLFLQSFFFFFFSFPICSFSVSNYSVMQSYRNSF